LTGGHIKPLREAAGAMKTQQERGANSEKLEVVMEMQHFCCYSGESILF